MKTLKGNSTRPTSDKVKGSLFNIIAPYIMEADVLDLYAGTGNLGIEALSRGAGSAVFVDKSRECYGIISDNLVHTKLLSKAEIHNRDVIEFINVLSKEGRKYDIIFMDPPYGKNFIEDALKNIEKNDIIKDKGLIVAESDKDDIIPARLGCLYLVRSQKYGGTVLSFFKKDGSDS